MYKYANIFLFMATLQYLPLSFGGLAYIVISHIILTLLTNDEGQYCKVAINKKILAYLYIFNLQVDIAITMAATPQVAHLVCWPVRTWVSALPGPFTDLLFVR